MSSEDLAALPAGTVAYYCPLPECGWVHAEEPMTPAEIAATAGEPVLDVALRQVLATEGALAAHLETHTLVEWVREVSRLRAELDRARAGKEREARNDLLLVGVLLRKLGGEAIVTDAELAAECGTLLSAPGPFGFRLALKDG